jgi:hypothetical protein
METGIANRIDKSTPLTIEDFPHEVDVPAGAAPDQVTRYRVKQHWYQDDVDAYWEQVFSTPVEQQVFRAQVLNNPPATVGRLMYAWLTSINNYARANATLTALINGLQEINAEMNNYAEHNNLCSEYEEKLGLFNDMLRTAGYNGWFQFEGRERTYDVLVERQRTVTERTWTRVTVTGTSIDEDEIADSAISNVEFVEEDQWEESDSFCTNYEMIEHTEA